MQVTEIAVCYMIRFLAVAVSACFELKERFCQFFVGLIRGVLTKKAAVVR